MEILGTYNAQKCLKSIIDLNEDVVYCLICNYISKIIPSLLSEFIILEYNNLYNSVDILKQIVSLEKLTYTDDELQNICSYYNTDVRSMINYLYNNNIIFNDNIYQDIVSQLDKSTIKNIILDHSINLNISPIKLLHLCLNKYIKLVPFDSDFILYIEKVFIYHAEIDYILYWWKYYNKHYIS